MIDAKPYNIFKKLKEKYSTVTVHITPREFEMQGLHLAFKDHRDYILHKFKQKGVDVYRFSHNYKSLDTSHPELGLVFLAGDSELMETMEVWALIGHNARWREDEGSDKR
jgi:hypothetical protein